MFESATNAKAARLFRQASMNAIFYSQSHCQNQSSLHLIKSTRFFPFLAERALEQGYLCNISVQWNPYIMDTIGTQHFLRYSEVPLTQGLLVYFR